MQAWLAILTNCVVFTFSSDQVIEYFPSLFRTLRLPKGGVDKVRCRPHLVNMYIHIDTCATRLRS